MRIALCIYGETRDYGKALPAWEAFMVKYQPDLFWHTWKFSPVYGMFSYNLKAGLVEAPKDFSWMNGDVTEYSSSALHVHPQMYSMQKAIQLMNNYHKDEVYDFVVRARFDLLLHNPEVLVFENLDPSKFYICANHWAGSHTIFDDNIMVSSYHNIIEHNRLQWYLHQFIHNKQVIPSGEQLLYAYFEEKGLMKDIIRTDALNFTLARNICA